MASSGSRGHEQIPGKESTVTAWERRLADAASVFQPFNASLRVGSEVERQTRSNDPNSLLPNRSKGPGILGDDSRFPTLDLTVGLGQSAGRPALSLPPVVNSAQQRAPAALKGQQADAVNVVMQLVKEGEEADASLMRNLSDKRKRREDLLRVLLRKINDSMESTSQLVRERTGFPDIVNSLKQELILQKRQHEKIVSDLQEKHQKAVTELHEERKSSETLLIDKLHKSIKDMEQALCRKAEPTILVETHEGIVARLHDSSKKTETALSKQHERTIAEVDARKEEEAAQLLRKHEGIVTKMQEERKEAETALTRQYERVVTDMREERKKSETLLVQKHDGMITDIQEARKEAETLLLQNHEMAVMEMRDVHEADRRVIHMQKMTIRDFEVQEARKKADQIMVIHNHKKILTAQVDSHRRAEAMLNQKHGKAISDIEQAHREAVKVMIENFEKITVEADDARKENEARLLRDHKVEMDAGKEREKVILQKQCELEAEVVKFKNMYHMALDSYTVLQKEHGEAKQAMQAQLASLQCQLAALKEEERTREKEHAEEVKRAMNAVPKFPESQLSTFKYKTRSKKEVDLVALQSELAKAQNDKVKLQRELDAFRAHQDEKIESKTNKLSIELLWEVAQKVLSFPEDVKESQTINTSGYETLVSTREENDVDKMMACVTVALKTAATNWTTAQDDYAKLKLAFEDQKHVSDTPKDISGDSNDSENASEKELPEKKRTRLFSLTELKELRERRGSSSQKSHPSRRKRTTPRRVVPDS